MIGTNNILGFPLTKLSVQMDNLLLDILGDLLCSAHK